MIDSIELANKTSEQLANTMDWLADELMAIVPPDHAIWAMVDHLTAEAFRLAVLCALAKAEA